MFLLVKVKMLFPNLEISNLFSLLCYLYLYLTLLRDKPKTTQNLGFEIKNINKENSNTKVTLSIRKERKRNETQIIQKIFIILCCPIGGMAGETRQAGR